MTTPTIAVKESRSALLEIGPSTGLPGVVYGLVYALDKGLYVWKAGDQSSNIPGSNDSDEWVAPSEDTSGKSGAWKRIVKERPEMSVIYHPEEATDAGTDQYGSEETTTPPSNDAVIARDFQSANTTTTPTLDGKTMTTRDGSALWADAVSGVHELQYASGTDTYLVLEPLPIDEDDMASDSDAAVPTQQSVKAYALTGPGTSSDPALAFDTWRTPNANRPTEVLVVVNVQTDGTSAGDVFIKVDESGGTTSDYIAGRAYATPVASSEFALRGNFRFTVQAGGSYRIINNSDPNNFNAIETHREFTL